MSATNNESSGQVENLLDHEYDGIREFDNPTPGWWHLFFFATVLFSVVYYFFFTFSPLASTPQQRWEAKQVREFERMFGAYGDLKPDTKTILMMKEDPKMMAVASSLFVKNCATCHGTDGGGINGFNLTDDNYKNVANLEDIAKVIAEGRNSGAMPAWGNRLNENERVILSSYVASLRGTKPANPKAADATEKPIAPWPTTAP
jgi:cytochrome c oxidase cbb3-type subunit 3